MTTERYSVCIAENSNHCGFYRLRLVVPFFFTLCLLGCGDTLNELIDKVEQQNKQWEIDHPAGVKVVFSRDIIEASKLNVASNGGNDLQVKLIADGAEHSMTVSADEAWIDWENLSFESLKPEPENVSHLYQVSIYYMNGSDGGILVAQASQRSDKIRTVVFTENMLRVAPYDIDNSGGELSLQEKRLLDSDEDGMANLAEIIVRGNPLSDSPTFVGLAEKGVPEKQKIATDSNPNYLVYLADAISPRKNANIIYSIEAVVGPSDAPFIIDAQSGELSLDAKSNKPWPIFDSKDINSGNNTYVLSLKASEYSDSIPPAVEFSTLMELTLKIADVFNLTATVGINTLYFNWDSVLDNNTGKQAEYYKVIEDSHGNGDFVEVDGGGHILDTTFVHQIAVHRVDKLNARYRAKAYRSTDNKLIRTSESFAITDPLVKAINYVKASDTITGDNFGQSVSISADGSTLAVGAPEKIGRTGFVYIYTRQVADKGITTNLWILATVLTAPNAGAGDVFGASISLSRDGRVLAAGATREDNAANGMMYANPDPCTGNIMVGCALGSGAVYVFELPDGVSWSDWNINNENSNVAYLKAPNAGLNDYFGVSLSISGDGQVLAVGALREDNAADVILGGSDSCDNSNSNNTGCALDSGAVYTFVLPDNTRWSEWNSRDNRNNISYLKAPNAGANDLFGASLSLSSNGRVLAVGASEEDNEANGTMGSGTQCITFSGAGPACMQNSGAVYVFELSLIGKWSDGSNRDGLITNNSYSITYIKPPNVAAYERFGSSLSFSNDGRVLAVGAPGDNNSAKAKIQDPNIDCTQPGSAPGCAIGSGAVYVLELLADGGWANWGNTTNDMTYLKAVNAEYLDRFGVSLSLSGDGNVLVIGANNEDSAAGANIKFDSCPEASTSGCVRDSGAVYVLERSPDLLWSDWNVIDHNIVYLKAPNAGVADHFGSSLSLNVDGDVLAVGAPSEDSDLRSILTIPIQSIPIDSVGNDNAENAGAVFLY